MAIGDDIFVVSQRSDDPVLIVFDCPFCGVRCEGNPETNTLGHEEPLCTSFIALSADEFMARGYERATAGRKPS